MIICDAAFFLWVAYSPLSGQLFQSFGHDNFHLHVKFFWQNEFTTRRACVFLQNSCTVGFSFTPPRCLWHPKNFSSESWQSFSLKKQVTPSMVNRNFTNATKDFTVWRVDRNAFTCTCMCNHYYNITMHMYIPVVRRPRRVSELSNIWFFSVFENPSRLWTLSSHLSK